MATNGSASPRPSAANTSTDPASGNSKAVPSAAPRNGPAHGVATKAASAPAPKLPAGRVPPLTAGHAEQADEVEGDGDAEQHQQHDRARVLQLERPAGRAAAGADRQQRHPERAGAEDGARRIGERIAPRLALVAAASRQMQRLDRQDREHARHQVEQDPAGDRAQHRQQQRVRAELGERLAARRDDAGRGGQLEPAAVAQREHGRELPWAARPCAAARRPAGRPSG